MSQKNQTQRVFLENPWADNKSPIEPRKSPESKHDTAPIMGVSGGDKNKPATVRIKRPPTSTLSVAPSASAPMGIPPTIRLKRPPTTPISLRPTELASGPLRTLAPTETYSEAPTVLRHASLMSGKRETSRIVIDDASGRRPMDAKRATTPIPGLASQGASIPQTIRLKRAPIMALSTLQDLRTTPTQVQDLRESPTLIKRASESSKGETSRIILDEPAPSGSMAKPTLAGKSATGPAGSLPRTIKLKRPGEGADSSAPAWPTPPAPSSVESKAATAKIDLPPSEPAVSEESPTQRKTIKIKRTQKGGGGVSISLPGPGTAGTANNGLTTEETGADAGSEAEENPLFTAVAVAAVLCVTCLVYILASQSLGTSSRPAFPVPSVLQVKAL